MSKTALNNKFSANLLLKYIPIIYPILIFLGFINYDLYYRKFGIVIFNYLELSEILLSFLFFFYPLIFNTLFYLFLSIIFSWLPSKGSPIYDSDGKRVYNETSIKKLKEGISKHLTLIKKYIIEVKSQWKTSSSYNKKYYLKNIFLLLAPVSFWLIITCIMLFYSSFLFSGVFQMDSKIENLYLTDYAIELQILSIMWLYFFSSIVREIEELSKDFKTLINFSIVFLLLFCNLAIYQNSRAYKSIYTPTSIIISFTYNNTSVITDDTNRFIGKTKNYLFIRNHGKNKNTIYPMNEIQNLEIIQIEE